MNLRGRRRYLLAIAAGLVAFGTVGVSASALGTVNPASLGTSTQVIVSCQGAAPVTLTWGAAAFSATAGLSSTPTFTISSVTISGVASDCYNKHYQVSISNAAGTAMASQTGTMAASASTVVTLNAGFDVARATSATLTVYG